MFCLMKTAPEKELFFCLRIINPALSKLQSYLCFRPDLLLGKLSGLNFIPPSCSLTYGIYTTLFYNVKGLVFCIFE